MDMKYDVVIVGGGFAGAVAARELTRSGLRALLVESRDRLGGRTWLREKAIGEASLEMGGTWIDPRQTESWSEAKAYGLAVGDPVLGAAPTTWVIASRLSTGLLPFPVDELGSLERIIRCLGNDASRIDPGRPLFEQDVADLDIAVTRYISRMDAPHDVSTAACTYLSMYGSAPPEEISALHILRRLSAAGSLAEFVMSGASHPLERGTDSLLGAIIKDAVVEIELSSPVHRIVQSGSWVSVSLPHRQVSCRAVVLTVPINVWKNISFDPPLSEAKRRLSEEELACKGFKTWLLARGVPPDFSACGDAFGFGMLWTEATLDDGSALVVAYGNDATAIDMENRGQLQAALQVYAPGAEVIDSCGHDWRRDPWSLETWPVFKPGQITIYERGLRRPEGRTVFAGSATALRWPGFIDGAIESGKRAAAEVVDLLRNDLVEGSRSS